MGTSVDQETPVPFFPQQPQQGPAFWPEILSKCSLCLCLSFPLCGKEVLHQQKMQTGSPNASLIQTWEYFLLGRIYLYLNSVCVCVCVCVCFRGVCLCRGCASAMERSVKSLLLKVILLVPSLLCLLCVPVSVYWGKPMWERQRQTC
jgi:hypothetical protein